MCVASFLNHPDTKFSSKNGDGRKKDAEGLWKLTPLMEIRLPRGFPQRLEKSLAHYARLFHSSHRLDDELQIKGKGTKDRIPLDDPDHLLENPTASVASLRGLIDISPEC
jgi:hypothetical protein